MMENKDPAIKLFGKTIQVGSNSDGDAMVASTSAADVGCEYTTSDDNLLCSKQGRNMGIQGCSTVEPMDNSQEGESFSSSGSEESKTLSSDKDCSSRDLVQIEEQSDQTNTTQSQPQNPPKKPEEILPCPRCNSMNTKFCYFNNYNVNQPRYFCKNCQRYWTAGGTMRNVPVGSGRRRSKHSQPDPPSGLADRANSRVLGPELNSSNGIMRPEIRIPNQEKGTCQGLIPPQMACLPNSSWPCAWNQVPWQSGYPIPFFSASPPQWVCNNSSGPWNLHFVPNPSISHDPSFLFLGKHSRDGTMLVPSNSSTEDPAKEKRSENPQVSMPRPLRIVDDPIEVARSSVWGSIGVKKDNPISSNTGVRFFRGFDHYKGADAERNNTSAEGSHLANQANPAAFCRSLSFHEVG